jgi:hypothetical protein
MSTEIVDNSGQWTCVQYMRIALLHPVDNQHKLLEVVARSPDFACNMKTDS